MTKQKITIVGLGYVGMSLAVLLGRTQDVIALDIDQERVDRVNAKKPTVVDPLMEQVLTDEAVSLVDMSMRLPIYGRAESLNLATAASVCLYETAFAQRAD